MLTSTTDNRSGHCTMRRFFRHLTHVLVLAAVVSACDDAGDREVKYLERGKELFENSEYIKARLEFRNVLQINPRSVEATYYLGRLDEINTNFPAATGRYRQAIEQDPSFIPARSQLARLYVMANDISTAEEQMNAILAQDPASADGRMIKASIFFRQGDIENAAAESGAVFSEDNSNATAAVILAQIHFKMGRPAEGMAVLEKAIARNPDNRNLARLKIQQYLAMNEPDKAEAVYLRLIGQWPDDLGSRAELAWFYISNDRLDDAEASLDAAVTDLPDDEGAKRMLVEFLLNHRGLEAAEKELQALIESHPDKPAYKFGLATLYQENDRGTDAATLYRQIIEVAGTAPDGLAARSALADQLLSEQKGEAAGKLIAEILEVDPQDGTALLLRGRLLLLSSAYDEAIVDLRTVLRDDPNSVVALGALAEAHLRVGQIELAMDALRNLVAMDSENVQAITSLAALTARTGNLAEANSLIQDALSIAPDDPRVLARQADIFISQGDFESATAVARKITHIPDSEIVGRLLLGRIFGALKRYADGLEEYRGAFGLNENSAAALNGVIVTLMAMDRLEEAEAFLEARLQKKPDDAMSYNLLGQVYNVAGRDMEMIAPVFLRAAELSPDWVEPILNHDRVLIQRGMYAQALTVIQSGLERTPSHEGLNLDLAYVYEKVGDFKSAIATYEKMIARDQGTDIVVNNLAALIADFEYDESARLERAFQLSSQFRDSNSAGFLETLGWVNYRLGDLEEAKRLVELAIDKGLDIPQVQYHLGMIYLGLGDKDRAREALTNAVAGTTEYPGHETARQTLASL
jgi:tetratricopeptide (TPR) repeat protein